MTNSYIHSNMYLLVVALTTDITCIQFLDFGNLIVTVDRLGKGKHVLELAFVL